MNFLNLFFSIILFVQFLHVAEELLTGFHKKWYLSKMPLWGFILFEVIFEGFWMGVLLMRNFPARSFFQELFLVLMFANGIQHVVWAGNVKKYVPGLITSFIHITVFLIFYFQVVF